MKKSFTQLFLIPLAMIALISFSMVPVAEAARGGGGAHAGGGNKHAGGGHKQASHGNRDARANNVRSSSTNNVNANRNRNTNINANKNVNVNVNNNRGGCCGGGWDNDYHPVATAVAVTAAVGVTAAVVGSMVNTVPSGCVPVNYGGMIYQQCGGTWYQPQGGQYVIINPPY